MEAFCIGLKFPPPKLHSAPLILSLSSNLKALPIGIDIKKILYHNVAFVKTSVTLGCTTEHTHPLVGVHKKEL